MSPCVINNTANNGGEGQGKRERGGRGDREREREESLITLVKERHQRWTGQNNFDLIFRNSWPPLSDISLQIWALFITAIRLPFYLYA